MLLSLLVLSAVLWVAVGLIGMIFRRRMRDLYPELAARLYPGALHKSISDDLRASGYLLRARYRELNNEAFVRFCDIYRVITLLWLVVFTCTIFTLLFHSVPHGRLKVDRETLLRWG